MRTPVRFHCGALLIAALALVYPGSNRSSALAATTITVINSGSSGPGSLDQAITDANTSSPPVTINFAIPPFDGTVKTIAPQAGLPAITNTIAINGFSQSGSSPTPTNNPLLLIELDGSVVGGGQTPTGLVFAVGGSVQGLIIQNFAGAGIAVSGSATVTETVVSNNVPTGIVVAGDTNLCTGNFLVQNSTAIVVLGSNNTFTANVITNNSIDGLSVVGDGNLFSGNLISSNFDEGVVIGGNTNSFSSNTISANGANGVTIDGGSNSVVSSLIVSNGQEGVLVFGTGNNSLADDTISANGAGGVVLADGSDTLVGSMISSNSGDGVLLSGTGNIVGGPATGAGNVIALNTGNGINIAATFIADSPTPPPVSNVVQGNFIGTDSTGTNSLGNSLSGILIDGTITQALDNVVGGESAGQANIIAFNGSNGVTIVSNAVNEAIFANSIFSNAVLGIDLGADGVTTNHPFGVFPSGPNNFQNFPVLTATLCSNAGVLIQGTIVSPAASNSVHLEFFSNGACDPSGFGQGESFIGSADMTTDLSGGATFSLAFTNFDLVGEFITATASDSSSNTSEFSQCMLVTDTQPPTILSCASPITTSTDSNDCQAVVPDFTAAVVATDNCSPVNDLVITQSPTNGTIAFLGTNTVTITVTDQAGNSTNCTTSFIVVDTTPPVITCQSDITNSVPPSQPSAVVTFPTPTATDNCSVTATVTCVPASGSIFPLGTTPVVCTAVDGVGNTASCTFHVVVQGPQQAIVDIAPGFCPNVFNTTAGGVIHVAIVGTESLNVSNIVPASVTLNGVLSTTNFSYVDEAVPFVYTLGCPKKKHDGILDLDVEFDANELVTSLGTVRNGQVLVLTVDGTFNDGTTFEGQDKIKISTKKCKLPKGLKNPF